MVETKRTYDSQLSHGKRKEIEFDLGSEGTEGDRQGTGKEEIRTAMSTPSTKKVYG